MSRSQSLHFAYCVVCSAVVHGIVVCLLILVVLQSPPSARPLVIETQSVEDPGAELVAYSVSISKPDAAEQPLMEQVIGDMSAPALAIADPTSYLAAGKNVAGQRQATAGTVTDGGGSKKRASFFGTSADGDCFVYVVDTSASMRSGNGRRLKRALDELDRSIGQLAPDQTFLVILFSTITESMFHATEPLPATEENKERLREWLSRVRADGGTQPSLALWRALELKPSADFLLSDGAFTRRGYPIGGHKYTASQVVTAYNPDSIPIHCIAFEEPSSMQNLLEIAAMAGGEYRFVPHDERPRDRRRENHYRESLAQRWLYTANHFAARGQEFHAQAYYQRILRLLPGTTAASAAKRGLSGG